MTNPFYPLLVLVGLAFAITACGFAVMMVRGISPADELDPAAGGGLMAFFQEYGFTALMIELGVLALATFGAIATDEMWSGRARQNEREDPPESSGNTSGNAPSPPPE